MNKKIAIIGLGNPLLKDDGVGLLIIGQLREQGLPEAIEAFEAGGSFYEYWELLNCSDNIILVDSLSGGGPPGTVYLLEPGEIARENESGLFRHDDGILNVLDIMEHSGARKKVVIIGVEPKEIAYSLEPSPEIRAKIPLVVEVIRELCNSSFKSGIKLYHRRHPLNILMRK
jgi:hydrogenase maturation protease